MTRTFLSILLFSVVINILSAQNKLVSYKLIESNNKQVLAERWKKKKVPQRIMPIDYAVDIYQVVYMTQWHDGTPIKASGYYYVPKAGDEAVPMLCYHHGTRIVKENNFKFGGEQLICTLFSASGYAVAQPDYIGLGLGEKFHLYHHVETEAMASIDMMRAIDELNEELGVKLSGQLFLTGYSQGGHATMATHKVIQEKFSDEFNIIASSPMSGAYDLTGAQAQAMFQKYSHPGYLPYLMKSMNEVYKIYDDFSYVFKEPYDSILPPMYNGMHSMGQINKLMPLVPKEILKDEFVEMYLKNPRYRFTEVLLENSTHNWKPEAPMQICYCNADEQVYYKNALVAYKNMKALGAENVRLKRGGRKFGHNTCAIFSTAYTKFYFDSFLKGSKKGRKGPLFKRMLISVSKIPARKKERQKRKEKETQASKN